MSGLAELAQETRAMPTDKATELRQAISEFEANDGAWEVADDGVLTARKAAAALVLWPLREELRASNLIGAVGITNKGRRRLGRQWRAAVHEIRVERLAHSLDEQAREIERARILDAERHCRLAELVRDIERAVAGSDDRARLDRDRRELEHTRVEADRAWSVATSRPLHRLALAIVDGTSVDHREIVFS